MAGILRFSLCIIGLTFLRLFKLPESTINSLSEKSKGLYLLIKENFSTLLFTVLIFLIFSIFLYFVTGEINGQFRELISLSYLIDP